MRHTDKWPMKCPTCPQDVYKTIAWAQAEIMMLCPYCGAEMTSQLHEAQRGIQQARMIEKENSL